MCSGTIPPCCMERSDCEVPGKYKFWLTESTSSRGFSAICCGMFCAVLFWRRRKGTWRVTVQWLRTDARARLPSATCRKSHGGTQGTVHPVGGGALGRWRMRYSKYSGRGNFFSLPNELFQLGLDYGELAVYSFLKRCENRKTHQCWPSIRTIGQAVGMNIRLSTEPPRNCAANQR